MEETKSCLFGLGVPQPEQCRLPEGPGGVGSTRQCISDKGMIEQLILVWDEPLRLSFKMERTDIYFRKCVEEIVENFELVAIDEKTTKITRTTNVKLKGFLVSVKSLFLFVGLKKVHRFVFKNWRQLAAEG
ncbi:MAG: hypothetical protein CMJ78_10605 [Planctomycetaceae bacterium]|nr:hypothetical protein [Planctomycetaceae bacterium]